MRRATCVQTGERTRAISSCPEPRAALTLRRDASVETIELSTDARDGVVTLSGSVADIGSRQKAERAVRELHGVRRVVNELEVAPAVR